MIKITFEDHGQDFLEWTIDEKGHVVDCEPFQFSIWTKYRVVNFDTLEAGDLVFFTHKEPSKEFFDIKYPVLKIEEISYAK